MSNFVCTIWHKPGYYEDWQLYTLTDCATTAAKMLLEDGLITGDTSVYSKPDKEGIVAMKKLKEVVGENKVDFIARALAAVGKYSFLNWSMEVREVWDKDDYAAEDEIYSKHIGG